MTLTFPFPDPPPPGGAVTVAPGVLWLRLPLPMALDHVNVWALEDADGWTVIDTGMMSRRSQAAWEALLAGPLAGRPLARVLVTHHHPDHVGMAGWLMARGADLLMPRTGWLLSRMLQLDVQTVAAPETCAFWRAAGLTEDAIAARASERPFNFADCTAPLPPVYTRLSEGQRLILAGRQWTVRMGDGHAPEHATLWADGGDLVIGGDQLLPGISPNLGVWPTEPAADPVGDWLTSNALLATHATAGQLVLPGHKLPFRGLPHRLPALIRHHEDALERLEHWLTTPRLALDCFGPLFGRVIGDKEWSLALAETVAHLNHLHLQGRAGRDRAAGGTWLWRRVQGG